MLSVWIMLEGRLSMIIQPVYMSRLVMHAFPVLWVVIPVPLTCGFVRIPVDPGQSRCAVIMVCQASDLRLSILLTVLTRVITGIWG